jgi:hypothetical protein
MPRPPKATAHHHNSSGGFHLRLTGGPEDAPLWLAGALALVLTLLLAWSIEPRLYGGTLIAVRRGLRRRTRRAPSGSAHGFVSGD